ncbi:hypothetical protein PLESTB_000580300 [Pleodorina starrii]|uniref:Uncharacterized protein n=1 Tax=Pleodorina starrii TaxID=330485 RepID=A0A9W6F0Q9_9CHLO|nr:hypothetical protein PLESTM_000304100 [Pleodorina starrii]GLC52077.1 hypothetical protein PLESTB_000580300 [Pleodorina starrii]GLC72220.1 hypothetical protein PLESTF_001220500 [Pleodorina starrii]
MTAPELGSALPEANNKSHYVFLSGAISGIVEGLSIQPLELLKTRFQINAGQPLRLGPTIREVLREGGVLQFYRGGLPEIVGLVPRATAALSTLEFSQRELRRVNGGSLSAGGAYLSGALSGVSEGVAFAPFQVIKVRLMAKEHLGRYKNSWDCLAKVVRQEGVLALATGLGPTLWRNCVWNSLYYGTMHQLEHSREGLGLLGPLDNPILAAARTIVVGTAVGMMATCFNAPFDVVKSRFQALLPADRAARGYRSTLPALLAIASAEGPRALYKGFVPKALRLGIGQTIGLMVFQRSLKAFGVDRGEGAGEGAEWEGAGVVAD